MDKPAIRVIDFQHRVYVLCFEDKEAIWKIAKAINDLYEMDLPYPRFIIIDDPEAKEGDIEEVNKFMQAMKNSRTPIENIQRVIHRGWKKILPGESSILVPSQN